MIIEHGVRFNIVGIEKGFWSVETCNNMIREHQDKFVPFSGRALGNHGAAEQPRNYPIESNRAKVKHYDEGLDHLVREYNKNSYNFILSEETTQYINRLTPSEDLNWHKDQLDEIETLYTKRAPYRISVLIYLNNKFKGGATEIYKYEPFKLDTGDALLFCCDMWHRSQPVTEGVKFSFNMWTRGGLPTR